MKYIMKRTVMVAMLLVLATFTATADVVWFDGKAPITNSIPKKVEPVVKIALDMWKSDMHQVTGLMPVTSTRPKINLKKSFIACKFVAMNDF